MHFSSTRVVCFAKPVKIDKKGPHKHEIIIPKFENPDLVRNKTIKRITNLHVAIRPTLRWPQYDHFMVCVTKIMTSAKKQFVETQTK